MTVVCHETEIKNYSNMCTYSESNNKIKVRK